MGIHFGDILLAVGLVLVVGASIFFATAWRTPAAFLGFFLWINIEDMVRILLGNQVLVFFVKTILFAALVCGFLHRHFTQRRGRLWKGFPVVVPLLLFLGLAIAQSFNPRIEHPLVPLIGLHAQFLYIPIFFPAYHFFDREERIKQFLLFIFGLAAVESLLTVPQMIWGPSWWYSIVGKPDTLEMFVGRAGARTGEELFRPSSIFTNAGRFYQYLSVISTILVGALFFFREKRKRLLISVSFLCVIVGVFLTSGRTTMYLLLVTLAAFLLLGFARKRARLQMTIVVMAAAFVLCWTLPSVIGKNATFIQNLFFQPLSGMDASPGSGNLSERILNYGRSLQRAVAEAGWSGHGTGSNSLGLYFIGRSTDGEEPGYAALVWEYGLVGLGLWLLLMGSLWFQSLLAYRTLRYSRYKPLAFAILLLVSFAFLYQYVGYQIMQNYLVTLYFWMFAAMLFALRRLKMEEDQARVA